MKVHHSTRAAKAGAGFVAVCLVLGATLPVTALAAESQPFQRKDVFELEWASNPKISPDGKR